MKHLLLPLILLGASLSALPAQAYETLYVNASQDAVSDKFHPGTLPVNTYLLWLRGNSLFTERRFGIEFAELDAIPVPVETIHRVWLQLYQFGGLGYGRARVRVVPASGSWTADAFPPRGLPVKPTAPAVERVVDAPNVGRWFSFEVTDIVKGWLEDPSTNHGFSVSAQPADTASEENSRYSIEFESVDSLHPEYSEQFGNDFPPGHPPHLKIQYRAIMTAERPTITRAPTASPVATTQAAVKQTTSKKQVKGTTIHEDRDRRSFFDAIQHFISFLSARDV